MLSLLRLPSGTIEVDVGCRWRWLPQLDRIAFRIVYPRETPSFGGVPFGLDDHRDPARVESFEHALEVSDAQVEHELFVRRPVIRCLHEGREDERAALNCPRPFVGRLGALGGTAGANTQMLSVPRVQRIRILRAEKDPTNSKNRHRRSPLVGARAEPSIPARSVWSARSAFLSRVRAACRRPLI